MINLKYSDLENLERELLVKILEKREKQNILSADEVLGLLPKPIPVVRRLLSSLISKEYLKIEEEEDRGLFKYLIVPLDKC